MTTTWKGIERPVYGLVGQYSNLVLNRAGTNIALLAYMTDFGEGSENTVVQRTAEIHSFGRDDMALAEELSASRSYRAQTELEEVPKSLWFKSVNLEHDPALFESDLPLPNTLPVAETLLDGLAAIGSTPIALESAAEKQGLPSPTPVIEARTNTRARSSAIPQVARSLVSRALLWEYLGLVIAAVCSVFVFEFIQNNGAISGAMLFPLFLLAGTTTWFALGLLGRYTWLSPLLSALGLWVLLALGWQLFAAMHAGYALLVTARSMLPTGGLRQSVS